MKTLINLWNIKDKVNKGLSLILIQIVSPPPTIIILDRLGYVKFGRCIACIDPAW